MRSSWLALAVAAVVGAVVVVGAYFGLGLGRVPDSEAGPGDVRTSEQTSEPPGVGASPDPKPARKTKKKPRSKPKPEPTVEVVTHVFPIADCEVSYSADHHNYPATDMFAAYGCPFVAPVSGTVDEVGTVDHWTREVNNGGDRGGLFVSIVGRDGVRYYGSHLSTVAPAIRPGVEVTAGTVLGGIGETGSALGTGSHLHFGMSWPGPADQWWVRRGVVAPARFLDAWRRGEQLSPVPDVIQARRELEAELATCQNYC
jgi:murein DD-endopeptidase MepM/ murein hydrolase activator NlpD